MGAPRTDTPQRPSTLAAPLLDPAQALLLAQLPTAQCVLEICDSASAIGAAYCVLHAGCIWRSVPPGQVEALLVAGVDSFDLLVLHADMQAVPDPATLLRALGALARGDAPLLFSTPNHASYANLQRLVEADLSVPRDALPRTLIDRRAATGASTAATTPIAPPAAPANAASQASPASVFKQLMDAGWMPQLVEAEPAPAPPPGVDAAVVALARALGMPPATVQRSFGLQHLVIEARRRFGAVPAASGTSARFAVVVPSHREQQLSLNVAASPGLREVNAPLLVCRGADNPAQALADALAHIGPEQDWVLLCHQDVYFPAGFGERLNALLDSIAPEDQDRSLIGFAGTAINASQDGTTHAGFVIDRLHRFDQPASAQAISVDEFAIVMSRRSVHRIDPSMGWHLWATDLCLAAICSHHTFARIERLPLFHNSTNDYTLPDDFYRAGQRLLAKYPSFGPITTLCGVIDAAFCQRGLDAGAARALQARTNAAANASPGAVAMQPARSGINPAGATPAAADRKPSMHAPADHATRRTPAPCASAASCCICGNTVSQWLPHPHIAQRSAFMTSMQTVGSDLTVYQCPSCGCNDRDRHLWLYMEAIGITAQLEGAHVLHIAPERHLEALIAARKPARYVRGDRRPHQPGHARLDVERLPFDDGCFDLVLCNHVLEHVDDPVRALAELHRCMLPHGVLIAQTPYSPRLKQTFELTDTPDAAFATHYFGQADHVRLFGSDLFALFTRAGFRGEPLTHDKLLPGLDPQRFGCNGREPFFVFYK